MTEEIPGIPISAVPLALAEMLSGCGTILHVAVNDRAMDQLAACLPFFIPEAELVCFPAWDCLPYDRVSPRGSLVAERVEALSSLASRHEGRKVIILTTVAALMQKVPPLSLMRDAVLELAPGKRIERDALVQFLTRNGYRRAGKAIEPGEFALRGSIVDIMPPGASNSARLDFFGADIETIRAFDPLTQLSAEALPRLTLHPAGEIALSSESIARFRERYREHFGAVSREDPLYEAISAGQNSPGMEHWLPLFFDTLDRLTDYAPNAAITMDAEAAATAAERHETIRDYYAARQEALKLKSAGALYHPLPPEALYLMEDAWDKLLESRNAQAFSPFGKGRGWRTAPDLAALRRGSEQNPFEQLKTYAAARPTVVACLSNGSRERISQLLAEHGMQTGFIEQWADIPPQPVTLATLPLERGFETDKVAVISEQDWLGERVIRAPAKKHNTGTFMLEAANFSDGELVVHREHGIGRFSGLVALEVQGAKHDCLMLVYEGGDKLFLPVENIDLLTRFGAEGEGVLDKLGAASWQARKSKMKERIRLAAEALLKVAALRQTKQAPVLECSAEAYDAFCARFGFAETEDQARSIAEVLEDLRSGQPMDRLVCGDVGFGKTEVAMRAAFVAVASGKWQVVSENKNLPCHLPLATCHLYQVAVVVPTTLLARQHYKNFRERFEGTGIRVAQLSRMVTAAEQKRAREGVADGSVHIVIGTHALLSKTIQFNNLGLLVVDEEQHFGVAQKEKLKALKADVHVLTLSATPIPRTLQMAMSGVRSLSLIATAPIDRLAVRSFVMPWDPVVLREAIMRERHRSGRVFVVCPRVRDIGELKAKLIELAPEIKIAVGHGQMAASELDSVMNDFYDGKSDLLLSTAIIESGLDIPQANTLIVYRADRFGLSQLYQLRGRVGRGKLRAYAYFLLPHGRELTHNATRRLEVMQSLDTLGAGFTLASHDMDIRGFGNLLGEEQSGHIREVGIELYQQMLAEAVDSVRLTVDGTPSAAHRLPSTDWSPQINLGLTVLIPENYVEDLDLRLGLYRRAAGLATQEEIDAFAAELIDRFGTLPESVQHLLDTVRLKQLCKVAGIARIDAGHKGAVLSLYKDTFAKPEALLAYISKHPTRLKLRPDQKIIYMQEWKDEAARLSDLAVVLEGIGKIAVP